MEDRDFQARKEEHSDLMIEFKTLAIKVDTNELYVIFLLKKNVWPDIIKMILGYSLIVAPETLKEWKVAITSVRQGYKSIEGWHNYKIGIRTTYGGQELPMDIRKSKEKFKDRKPRYFNCDIYRHMVKDCKRPEKEKDNRNCYKCEQVGYITKDYRTKQKIKDQSVQDNTEIEEENKKKDFVDSSK